MLRRHFLFEYNLGIPGDINWGVPDYKIYYTADGPVRFMNGYAKQNVTYCWNQSNDPFMLVQDSYNPITKEGYWGFAGSVPTQWAALIMNTDSPGSEWLGVDYYYNSEGLYTAENPIKDLILPEGITTVVNGALLPAVILTDTLNIQFPDSCTTLYINSLVSSNSSTYKSFHIPKNLTKIEGLCNTSIVDMGQDVGHYNNVSEYTIDPENSTFRIENGFVITNETMIVSLGTWTFAMDPNTIIMSSRSSSSIPKSVSSLGPNVFSFREDISDIYIPKHISTVRHCCCANNPSLKRLILGTGVSSFTLPLVHKTQNLTDLIILSSNINSISKIRSDAGFTGFQDAVGIVKIRDRIFNRFEQIVSTMSYQGMMRYDSLKYLEIKGDTAIPEYSNQLTHNPDEIIDAEDNLIFVPCPEVIPSGNIIQGQEHLIELAIPNHVTSIYGTFGNNPNLEYVYIGTNVQIIGDQAFCDCSSLSNITFGGTMEQWGLITLGSDWNLNVPATVVHCTDGDVAI